MSMVEGISEGDRMVVRLLSALHAEKSLEALNIAGIHQLFQALAQSGNLDGLPAAGKELDECLDRLEAIHFIEIDRRNPHLTVGLQGLLTCGLLPIPQGLIAPIKELLGKVDLR